MLVRMIYKDGIMTHVGQQLSFFRIKTPKDLSSVWLMNLRAPIFHYGRRFFCMVLVALMSVASAKLIEPIINDIFVERHADMLVPITVAIFLFFLSRVLPPMGNLSLLLMLVRELLPISKKRCLRRLLPVI
jgi:hypothetical protein